MSLPLYALILQLHPTADVTLPAMVGTQAHAAFLGLVAHHHPDLAAHLHADHKAKKPFGVSLLVPTDVLRRGDWRLRAGSTVRLRITLAGAELFQSLMDYFVRGQSELQIGPARLATGRIITSGVDEPLAGYSTLHELAAAARPEPRQTLRFIMPTAIKDNGANPFWLLPDPLSVFKSLSLAWATWAKPIDPALCFDPAPLLAALAAHQVSVGSHHLRTVQWSATKGPRAGFVGSVQYVVADDPVLRRTIDLLARFAFFAGVGNSSGRGMGVVTPETARAVGSAARHPTPDAAYEEFP